MSTATAAPTLANVLYEKKGPIAYVTINRPKVLNALNKATIAELNEVFKEIQNEMRNQYSIGYISTNAKKDGTFRHIEIKTNQSEYRVQARNGYYATPNDAR